VCKECLFSIFACSGGVVVVAEGMMGAVKIAREVAVEEVAGVREVREAGVTGAGARGRVLLMTLPRLIREWC
jgi:hypothetical protein